MFHALSKLQRQVAHHLTNLADMQPWDNRKFMEDVAASVDAMLATPPLPEHFASMPVVGSIKVADVPTEHPHKYVIVTQDHRNERSFNVHTIAFDGDEWVGVNGRYDMPYSRALDDMVYRAEICGRPTTA